MKVSHPQHVYGAVLVQERPRPPGIFVLVLDPVSLDARSETWILRASAGTGKLRDTHEIP